MRDNVWTVEYCGMDYNSIRDDKKIVKLINSKELDWIGLSQIFHLNEFNSMKIIGMVFK